MKITPIYKEIDKVELSYSDMVHLIDLLPNVQSISFEKDNAIYTFDDLKDLTTNSVIDKVNNLRIEYSQSNHGSSTSILNIYEFGPRHTFWRNDDLRAKIDNFLRQKTNVKLNKSLIYISPQHNHSNSSQINIKGNNNIVGNRNKLTSVNSINKNNSSESKNIFLRIWKSFYVRIFAPILVSVIGYWIISYLTK